MPGGAGQASITGHERYIESLGKRHVCGVIRSQVVAEKPDALTKRVMSVALDHDVRKKTEGSIRLPGIDLTGSEKAA